MENKRFIDMTERSLPPKPHRSRSIFQLIFVVLFLLVFVGGIAYIFLNDLGLSRFIDSKKGFSDGYYSIFLDNEQVYFGKVISVSDNFITLNEVFYLQANDSGGTNVSEAKFNLIKLGQELHGPKDEMGINLDHVVFYEELRDDSKVVQSINSQ